MEKENEEIDPIISSLDKRLKAVESVGGWGSLSEKYIITSVLILMSVSLVIIIYMVYNNKITNAESFFVLLTTLLGYLFGYLPTKEQEKKAIKELELIETDFKEYKIKTLNLEKERYILDKKIESSEIALEKQKRIYEEDIIPRIIDDLKKGKAE